MSTYASLNHWFERNHFKHPFVIVGGLPTDARQKVADQLEILGFPVYLEAISGIRELPRLQNMRIKHPDNLWNTAENALYPIDAVIRIGSVPTLRAWRDLEHRKGIKVFSVSHLPFRGLSFGDEPLIGLEHFVQGRIPITFPSVWKEMDEEIHRNTQQLFHEENFAETTLFFGISKIIPEDAMVYLGNSTPIREWDLFACNDTPHQKVFANRGANGIDGQVSTFLGLASQKGENWAILGDLTTLYDMAGFWILPELREIKLRVVVVNNGGGRIFERMFNRGAFQNTHNLSFKPLADMWKIDYQRWDRIEESPLCDHQLIELIPDHASTNRFWNKYSQVYENVL